MTCLLLGAALLPILAVCPMAQELLIPPEQVRFDSVDYKNILHWTPPTNSSSLHYHVQWKIYGEPEWLDVQFCQGIQKLRCDLSCVTGNPTEWYYARVSATSSSSKSAWALSPRFSPRWDTRISTPALKLTLNEQNIVVQAKPSRRLKHKMRNHLHHKIYVSQPGGEEEVFEMDCCSHKLTLTELKHNTSYCVQAQTFIPLYTKSSARGSEKCITTP